MNWFNHFCLHSFVLGCSSRLKRQVHPLSPRYVYPICVYQCGECVPFWITRADNGDHEVAAPQAKLQRIDCKMRVSNARDHIGNVKLQVTLKISEKTYSEDTIISDFVLICPTLSVQLCVKITCITIMFISVLYL